MAGSKKPKMAQKEAAIGPLADTSSSNSEARRICACVRRMHRCAERVADACTDVSRCRSTAIVHCSQIGA
eukprot:5473693-Pleurochrysis_carterae.AAC.1